MLKSSNFQNREKEVSNKLSAREWKYNFLGQNAINFTSSHRLAQWILSNVLPIKEYKETIRQITLTKCKIEKTITVHTQRIFHLGNFRKKERINFSLLHIWSKASHALMWERNAFPRPWPSDAPFTSPAISTTFRNAGTLL